MTLQELESLELRISKFKRCNDSVNRLRQMITAIECHQEEMKDVTAGKETLIANVGVYLGNSQRGSWSSPEIDRVVDEHLRLELAKLESELAAI